MTVVMLTKWQKVPAFVFSVNSHKTHWKLESIDCTTRFDEILRYIFTDCRKLQNREANGLLQLNNWTPGNKR